MSKRKRIRKIFIALLIIFLAVGSLYCRGGIPRSSPTAAFRQMEKKAMIGPAEIFAVIDVEHGPYDRILIGESDYGYTFFEWKRSSNSNNSHMDYIPKREGVTLYCTYYMYGSEEYSRDWLPIFAFTDNQTATSARLTLTTAQDGERISYSLEARRDKGGYFLFSWKTLNLRSRDFWLVQQFITDAYRNYILDGSVTATIELFDHKGNLLETHQYASKIPSAH